MKPRLSNRHETAMTLFEVGVIIAIVVILAAMVLPSLLPPERKVKRLNCTNNLKQIGLAFRIWSGDGGDHYPMGVSVTNGGSKEMVVTGDVVRSFLAMSNELSIPKLLCCPADTSRTWATDFSRLANSNISYFVGAEVRSELDARAVLSGDCNFEIGGALVKSGLLSLGTNDPVAWSAARHVRWGNIELADGSVQSTTTTNLRNYFVETEVATNRLAIP